MEVHYEETHNEGRPEEYSLQFIGDYSEADETAGFNAQVDLVQVLYTTPKLDNWVDITPFFFDSCEGFDIEKIEDQLADK